MRTLLPAVGVEVVDFSDGLLAAPRRGDFATYMERGEIVERVPLPQRVTAG